MLDHKIDTAAAMPFDAAVPPPLSAVPLTRVTVKARLMSTMIVLALPLFLLWLLAGWLWKDVLAVGRVIRQFHRDATEEYSRLS